jgi:hypothetical protein
MKIELTKDLVEDFVLHPQWPLMLAYIEQHFANSTEVDTIDTGKDSSVVHAEVIARQRIKNDLQGLKETFALAKKSYSKKKMTYE